MTHESSPREAMINDTPGRSELGRHWQLNPDIDFLNHGSFGACPTVVLRQQRQLRNELESDPIRFLAAERELIPKLDQVRELIGRLIGADPQDVAFVRNATDGVNAVLRSLKLQHDDEIVITDHGYNACNNAARFVAERSEATVKVAKVPFPTESSQQVVDAVVSQFSEKTKLMLIDHVTSATAIVLPIASLISAARERGVMSLVDGAHAPGMISVDLHSLDPDFYTANHHKWCCGPKASGFLFVRRQWQSWVRPTVISHGANRCPEGRSRYLAEFDWVGTYDPTPLLAMPTAIEFLDSLVDGGFEELQRRNRKLAIEARSIILDALGDGTSSNGSEPAPASMLGSMATIVLPEECGTSSGEDQRTTSESVDPLQTRLYREHGFEVPVFRRFAQGPRTLRISAQAYNTIDQYQRLADALVAESS